MLVCTIRCRYKEKDTCRGGSAAWPLLKVYLSHVDGAFVPNGSLDLLPIGSTYPQSGKAID